MPSAGQELGFTLDEVERPEASPWPARPSWTGAWFHLDEERVMANRLLRIQGMSCAHCADALAAALVATGAASVAVDWRRGST